jgi:hypothetical protein
MGSVEGAKRWPPTASDGLLDNVTALVVAVDEPAVR